MISRAHLVDLPALVRAARENRIRLATDVFPTEPVALDDPVRGVRDVILSPHRAAAVEGGRRLIGEMIADDVAAILGGEQQRRLLRADPLRVGHIVNAPRVGQNASR